jgi:5,10-methenyltetrahydrofolate synthetase
MADSQPNPGSLVLKAEIRKEAARARREHPDRDQASALICDRLVHWPVWEQGRTVLFYINVRDEVVTTPLIQKELTGPRRCIVPYCSGDVLKLIWLKDWNELERGAFGILEPGPALRDSLDRHVSPGEIDLALIPGVAFDRCGGRLGHGRGFYDRLIPELRSDCIRVGLAFECQLVPQIPMDPHDQYMHTIITEREIIPIRS